MTFLKILDVLNRFRTDTTRGSSYTEVFLIDLFDVKILEVDSMSLTKDSQIFSVTIICID